MNAFTWLNVWICEDLRKLQSFLFFEQVQVCIVSARCALTKFFSLISSEEITWNLRVQVCIVSARCVRQSMFLLRKFNKDSVRVWRGGTSLNFILFRENNRVWKDCCKECTIILKKSRLKEVCPQGVCDKVFWLRSSGGVAKFVHREVKSWRRTYIKAWRGRDSTTCRRKHSKEVKVRGGTSSGGRITSNLQREESFKVSRDQRVRSVQEALGSFLTVRSGEGCTEN
jgi:hypothetical protein